MTEIIDRDDEQMSLPFVDDPVSMDRGEMVREFMTAFQASDDPALWLKLMKEELQEVREAIAALLKELVDLEYVSTGAYIAGLRSVDDDEMADMLGAINRLMAAAVPEPLFVEAFRRVHESNMSKLGADGKPVRRDDGKILKGPNYQPPYLMDLI